jgi:hypothetical protein
MVEVLKPMPNPALEKLVAQIDRELVLAQVFMRRQERGYELRHVQDRHAPAAHLPVAALHELRRLAQFTPAGAFRPLKSAPTLPAGWRIVLSNDAELELALNHLYPGAIADWFAAQTQPAPVTDFREFAGRQTGMYQVTRQLDDAQVAEVAQTCCQRACCLKRRLWSVTGLAPDAAEQKSIIPCLEPCAVLLEAARKACCTGDPPEEVSPEKD